MNVEDSETKEVWFQFQAKTAGGSFDISLAESDTVQDLKAVLFSLTNVPPDRQKIIGLIKAKLPPDEALLGHLALRPEVRYSFRMIGTPIGDEFQEHLPSDDGFESSLELPYRIKQSPSAIQRHKRKINESISKLEISYISAPRRGKNLVVLDLDYTLLDSKAFTSSHPAAEFARPGLQHFLETVYPYYDIVIWSATSWKRIESKCYEMGIVGQPVSYEIAFVLDKTSMFKLGLENTKTGKSEYKDVKPLELIFSKVDCYSIEKTVHIDDIPFNFMLNPTSGIVCSPYRDSAKLRAKDRELYYLSKYLLQLAELPDLRRDHRDWRDYQGPLPEGTNDPTNNIPQ